MKSDQYPVTLHYADHAFEPPIGIAPDLVESLKLPVWAADILIAIYSICNGSKDGIPDDESGITLWDVEKVTQVHKSAGEDTLRLGDWMFDADFVAIRKSDPSDGVFLEEGDLLLNSSAGSFFKSLLQSVKSGNNDLPD